MPIKLTTRDLSMPYWTGFRAEGSTGASIGAGVLGPVGGSLSRLVIPMTNDKTGEKINVVCTGVGMSVGAGSPVTVEISPSHLPSSGIGNVFAGMDNPRPFPSKRFEGAVVATTFAGSGGVVGRALTVVAFVQSTTMLIDPPKGKAMPYKAVCLLQGLQYAPPSAGVTVSLMSASVEKR